MGDDSIQANIPDHRMENIMLCNLVVLMLNGSNIICNIVCNIE